MTVRPQTRQSEVMTAAKSVPSSPHCVCSLDVCIYMYIMHGDAMEVCFARVTEKNFFLL